MSSTCPECGSSVPEHASECPVCHARWPEPGGPDAPGSGDADLANTREAWLTVAAGSMSEILALRALVEDAGIPTFVPDSMIKVIDPFITGGNVFEMRLQVPADHHAQAAELLARARRSRETQEALQGQDAEQPPEESVPAYGDLERLGRRIRWAAVMFITAPVGVLWGLRYLSEAKQRDPRPSGHFLTVVAFWLSLVNLVFLAYVLGWIL